MSYHTRKLRERRGCAKVPFKRARSIRIDLSWEPRRGVVKAQAFERGVAVPGAVVYAEADAVVERWVTYGSLVRQVESLVGGGYEVALVKKVSWPGVRSLGGPGYVDPPIHPRDTSAQPVER